MSESQAEMAPDRKAAWDYINKREADHREALQQMIEREVERRYSEEWSREGNAFLAGWRACSDTLAPPAPPVATTGAVPRDAISILLGLAGEQIDRESARGNDDARDTDALETVRSWLSAAPAPKASEGEAKCMVSHPKPFGGLFRCDLQRGHDGPHHAADEKGAYCDWVDGPKASEGECYKSMVAGIAKEMNALAQPHARAEGANAEAMACLRWIGTNVDCDTSQENDHLVYCLKVIRAALSGSAGGRP